MKKIATFWLMGVLCASLSHAQTVTYQESSLDFPNPERGFYRPLEAGYASNFPSLNASELTGNRTTPYTPYSANYQIQNTLVYRYYVLDNFKSSAISTAYLNNVRNDLTTIRQAGVKIIMRFAYTIEPNQTGCPDNTACPPYGDAPKQRVLAHIAQLKSIFSQYRDVIAVVQMGFIGVWGEQYYTDFFGDSSGNGNQGKLLDNNWQDRLDVLNALLAAVPESRMVQVRYPQIKQKAVYGINAPVTSAPITAAQAHNGSKIARIGFHNDCFLSSPDDFGTYFNYGTSSTSASSATNTLKPYFANDSRYTVVGGETCSDGFSPQNDCSGIAVSDMQRLHYSYLNSEFSNEVNNDWQTGGCMDEIKRSLGYRLVMEQGTYASQAQPGSRFDFSLNLKNVGFAAPYNPRLVELVLRNTASGSTYKIPLTGEGGDVRFWLPEEEITLNRSLTLPAGVPAGSYELLLNLPDTSNNNIIANRPEYAIRLANENVWEAATGYNKLNHTLTVTSGGGSVANAIGEVGNVSLAQASASQWHTVTLNRSYVNPIVVLGPASFNGAQPITVRVRNVTSTSFQYQLDEWDYLDGGHTSETVSYLVVEAGTHDLGNGQTLIAGQQSVGTGFASISYREAGPAPVVLTQVTTANDPSAVVTRVRSVSTTGFEVRLQEEENAPDGGSHANETVAWVAISSGRGTAGRAFEAVRSGATYQQNFQTLSFGASYSNPVLLATLQSYNGSDPATLRYQSLLPGSVSLKVEEETSRDSETGHANEVVGALVFAGSGPITGQASGGGGTTTAIVVDGEDDDWNSVATLATSNGNLSSLKAYHDADKLYLLVAGSLNANNQFYLDTDNSNGTGYRDAAQWSDMGADFLIENGTLFSYTGSGTDFSWSPVTTGSPELIKNNALIEMAIPRSALGGVESALRIGYADLDGNYNAVAKLPAAGPMALYSLGNNTRRANGKKPLVTRPDELLEAAQLSVYPNPGRDQVTVIYTTQEQKENLQLEVYDLAGRLERTLISEAVEAGSYRLLLETKSLGYGVHIIRLQTNGQVITHKLVVE